MEKVVGKYKVRVSQDTNPENPRTSWDNLGTMVCFHNRYDLGDKHEYNSNDYNSWKELFKAIDKKENACIILPLYLYDHSGITMKTSSFNDRWDSGQVGFIFVSKEKVRKEYSVKRVSKKLAEKVAQVLEGEVETYDKYLTGEVYGYEVLDEDDEVVDSCWGYYDEDDCMNEGVACVPEEEEITEAV